MLLRPAKPAIRRPNQDLAYVNRLLRDPTDCGFRNGSSHRSSASTALRQRLGRSPYTPRSYVAMQLQGNCRKLMSSCALGHKVDSSRANNRFSPRYFCGTDSKRIEKLGLQKAGSLSAATVSNIFQNSYDFIQPLVDVVQGPSNSHESDNEHPEVPGGHRSILPKLGRAYARPLFLAGSYFTGRTPQPAIVVPCCAAAGGRDA